MAELSEVASSLKRPFPEDELVDTEMPNTPSKAISTAASSPLSSLIDQSSRDVSMLPSIADEAQSPSPKANPASSAMPPSNTQKTSSAPGAQPQKRRKLTTLERAQEQAEKQVRKEAKEKEKAAKDKERVEAAAKKEDEKRKKAEEQEQKRKAKEAEKLKKEEEHKAKEEEKLKKAAEAEAKKKAREEEKLKKERVSIILPSVHYPLAETIQSQMRLSAFFNAPKASPPAPLSDSKTLKASASPSPPKFITKDEARRKSLSLEPGETVESLFADIPKLNLTSNLSEQAKKQRFLPFTLPKQAVLAPHNRFLPLKQELARVNEHLDSYLTSSPALIPTFTEELEMYKLKRGYTPFPVQGIVERIHGSSNNPIDLTSSSEEQPQDLLRSCTMKYLHFSQDVRPPYCGTWTKPQSFENARKLARNPFKQLLPELDYDYDSEAEWEEPEDGEDLDSDGESDEEDGDEDMEGFLDDDNPPDYLQARKGQMSNDLVPVCTGLQWEDASGVLHAADGGQAADFSSLKMGALLGQCPRIESAWWAHCSNLVVEPRPPTIDPFTRAYWEDEPLSVAPLSLKDQTTLPLVGLMNPPRIPLQDRPYGFLNGANVQGTVNGKVPKAAKVTRPGRVVPADLLPAFKKQVEGSDMTKIAMIEHLKATCVNISAT
jgi:chromatin assembly factor 1 subunit A